MPADLQPLDRPLPLHQSVQAALRRYIVDRDLRAGDPLPSEAELARRLGVGRNSVREGVKALESLGVVEVRRGAGVYVRAFTLGPLLENLPYAFGQTLQEVQDILQIRQALELSLIEAVVDSTTAAQLAGLRGLVGAMEIKAARGQDFADEDRAFHHALFQPLGNAMLLSLLDAFWHVFRQVAGPARLETQDPVKTWQDHQAIVDAVAERDVALAKRRLTEHYRGISGRLDERRERLGGAAVDASGAAAVSSAPAPA